MRKSMWWAVVGSAAALCFLGCAAPSVRSVHPATPTPAAGGEHTVARADRSTPPLAAAPETPAGQHGTAPTLVALPSAPWSAAPVAPHGGAASVVRAWRHADNRAQCAPLAPSSLGVDGAHARASSLDGGWAVEFDRPGLPGVRQDGHACTSCGRGAFGIAGTAMTPDEATDPSASAAPSPTFRDGSRADVVPADAPTDAAAATITVAGQNCVYQVWSFLGADHVRKLVHALRFVELNGAPVRRVATVR